jgi:hypothetical protein
MPVTVGIQGMGARAGTPSSHWAPLIQIQAAIPRALPPPPAGIFTPNPGRSQARMHVQSTSVWQIATLLVPDPIGSSNHRQTAPVSAVNLSIVLLIPGRQPRPTKTHALAIAGTQPSASFFQHHLQLGCWSRGYCRSRAANRLLAGRIPSVV